VVRMDLHVIGATTDGKLWHTLRRGQPAERSWEPFGDVKRQARGVGSFVDVDCARELRDVGDSEGLLHVVGVTGDGRLWYTVRDPALNFGWTPFRDVELSAGGTGPFLRAAVATARQADRVEVVVAGVTADGGLWATTRKSGSEFHPFARVAPAGDDPTVRAVALADAAGSAVTIHLAAVSGDGRLWHAVGRPGQWPRLTDVEKTPTAGDRPGDLTDVACAGGGDLNMVAVAGDGHVWHTTRDPSNRWTPFTDAETTDVGSFTRVGVARIQSGLHICGVTSDGKLWHRLRGPGGDGFGDVKKVIKPPPELKVSTFQAVACA
jgi:hypothetical protein